MVLKNIIIKAIVSLSKALNLPERNYTYKPNRFLIVTPAGVGDTLWATPAIRALKETYPESYLGVLVTKTGSELLKGNPDIDELFIFKRSFKGFFSLPKLLKILRQRKFTVALMFHAWDRMVWLICYFTGAGEIIGFKGTRGKRLDFILTKGITISDDINHWIDKYLSLVKELKAFTSKKCIDIYLNNDDRIAVKKYFNDCGGCNDSLMVGLHPGGRHVYKLWNQRSFIQAANALVEKFNCKVIITGSAEEKMLDDKIASKIKNAISVAGVFDIRETAALIERLDLFITNDTGPMHIASALKTPTIALFSPTNPLGCGPYYCETASVIAKPKPEECKPCTGSKCVTPTCMEQITVKEVIAEAEVLLAKK
tara:strand:- start:12125 stop:13231 length:1107 start_codon:yes stop_codon:yes gene_type:complete